jgi:hypothetical protein
LAGRSVLLSTQTLSALTKIAIDGIARRILICPPDINPKHIETLVVAAAIDAVVTDQPMNWAEGSRAHSCCSLSRADSRQIKELHGATD